MQNFDRISALAQNIDQSQRSISFFLNTLQWNNKAEKKENRLINIKKI